MEGEPLNPPAAYKFLRPGAVGPFSGFSWPTPTGGVPGEWVEVPTDAGTCRDGVHACKRRHLPYWIWEELWEVELEGDVERIGHKIRASRGRLVRRIESWAPDCAKSFAVACARRAAHHAARALRDAGHDDTAEVFEGEADLGSLRALTAKLWEDLATETRIPVGMASDAALRALTAEASGEPYVSAHGGAVCAYIAAMTALRTAGEAALERERSWQADWLGRELAVD
jgi:hypothetical protein